eukprot:GHVU01038720.1.p1 GENE.GHVU01038720.1~~GHVU01038720.1.p1  ORF type:complete len:126 (-),score=6.82 GHVU01038720.1:350-727(-)
MDGSMRAPACAPDTYYPVQIRCLHMYYFMKLNEKCLLSSVLDCVVKYAGRYQSGRLLKRVQHRPNEMLVDFFEKLMYVVIMSALLLVQQHEPGVASSNECRDEVFIESVDYLAVPADSNTTLIHT